MTQVARRRLYVGRLCVAITAAAVLAVPLWASPRRVELDEGMFATLTDSQEAILEALPLRHEGLIAFSLRLCGERAATKSIAAANGSIRRLLAGVWYRVPYHLLRPELQRRVVEALFDRDSVQADGWHHFVSRLQARQSESLWRMAEWFTGDGGNYRRIREFNGLADEEIVPGQEIVIPRELLLPAFAALGRSQRPDSRRRLEYGEDGVGRYAIYTLRAGEALYSSVVIRFTGRIYVDDVNRLAGEIAARSGISDVSKIPVGYKVKIPLDVLLSEFLPIDHPRRVEYEDHLSRSAQFSNPAKSLNLAGVTVVLDAGHGGRDVGASVGKVWESVYVYDVMLRVRRLLMATTAAEVVTTTRDGADFVIVDRDVLSASRGHAVLTSPPYPIDDARVSSNLRWYLANSIFLQRVRGQQEPEKIVFLSIHADSLHPSLRGAMVYLPGLLKTPKNYGKTGTIYTSRREVREHPRVSFSPEERVVSEGLSRDIARSVIEAFSREGLKVHDNKPVRDRVVRHRRAWVPAVLRFNAVPAKVLVEVCNLANKEDRGLLETRAFRQRVAQAIVEGLLTYYGHPTRVPDLQVATR